MKASKSDTQKKMYTGIAIIIVLAICLAVTTFALIYATVNINDNLFHMGHVEIDLNDGQPVIQEDEFLFEPGMRVVKSFYIQNKSSTPVWIKFYFENVTGGLSNFVEITIKDDQNDSSVQGTVSSLTKDQAPVLDTPLGIGEKKWLIIQFRMPEETGNAAMGQSLEFDFCADAVQTKNNPDKVFN